MKCSAYTHVFADTIRSIAVLVASVLAQFISNISAEQADSSAAVAVSIIILIALCPLFAGLRRTAMELLSLRREEISEKIHNGIGMELVRSGDNDAEESEQVLFV